jgi:late competence protein required for DNA uptake (superfamily II DNA/RNA helicase)
MSTQGRLVFSQVSSGGKMPKCYDYIADHLQSGEVICLVLPKKDDIETFCKRMKAAYNLDIHYTMTTESKIRKPTSDIIAYDIKLK